jgi:hypothetical protein
MGKKADRDSAEAVVANIVSTGKSTGYRASEYSQDTQKILTTTSIPVARK